MPIDDNFGLGPARGWLARYGPMIAFLHFLFACMAVQVSIHVWFGGSPITPELYGPAVYHIPALMWTVAQVGTAALVFLGAVLYWPRLVAFGAFCGLCFYAVLSMLAAFGEQGTILQAGASWVFMGVSSFTMAAGLGARRNVRR